ncbi:hypothetical protein P154DRAFT_541526 [Amniculicola lignicola CBS 123094]|uniref:PIN domain-containing protein n=1 Tax=Amniculicola lignicola CBS 123094 TaxID=1392246 RepID=A0A6A5X346_9PLEO|nr:hypothetical protein P154DRAFT_541526 [Amniculicola lignicola CBS 123094]
MRRNTFPLRPRADAPRTRAPAAPLAPAPAPAPMLEPTRKVFNCIVDDTALIAGVKKSTRDGIRKWVSMGAVRLFVPLHTLSQLDRLKKGTERIHNDAREAIKWLDDVTSMPAVDSVQLEGVDEAYGTWEEVEQFLLPQTLLSMEESESEEEDYHEDLESSFNALDVSDGTSMSSTQSLTDSPKASQPSDSGLSADFGRQGNNLVPQIEPMALGESPDRTARNSAELPRPEKSPRGTVPAYLKPLFNHILWRIHKETNPDAALESFILLTNDPAKQIIAQKFGIRAKRLEQLRDAVGREEREYRNRLTVYKIETDEQKARLEAKSAEQIAPTRPKSAHSKTEEVDSDEDVVLLKRAPRGPQAQSANGQRVWDPNEFGRSNQPVGGRGGRGNFPSPRGRGAAPRGGRGGFAPRGGTYVPPGPPFRAPPAPAPRVDPNQPIDPDSFARPSIRGGAVRGAIRRKLWEPN